MKTQHDNFRIGETILVECVKVIPWTIEDKNFQNLIWIPVLPYPEHEDAEHLGFEDLHLHYDFRFWTRRLVEIFMPTYEGQPRDWGSFVCLKQTIKERKSFPLQCLRETPQLSTDYTFIATLEEAYKDCKLSSEHLCPHKHFKVIADGDEWYCPGHGLKFDRNDCVIQRY